jgi:predicted DNA repair protein MutK
MAGSSLLLLIDDIAAILDDVAVLTKVAAKKTAGVLGDDLALNAQQVAGVRAERELPVVWAVAKGSMWNKAILVPTALAISLVAPWAITPLLMLGGAFLCYEGVEKLAHKFLHPVDEMDIHRRALTAALVNPEADLLALEKEKVKGAIRTDFILSAEIIVITLGTAASAPFLQKVTVLMVVAIAMTIGVYGLVAGIVKLDDAGLHMMKRAGSASFDAFIRWFGRQTLLAAPWLMKLLSVAGTAAMFLVGGSILVHGWPALQHLFGTVGLVSGGVPYIGLFLDAVIPTILDGVFGVIAGAVCLSVVFTIQKLRRK